MSAESSSGVLNTRKMWTCEVGPEEAKKIDQRAGAPLLQRQAERARVVQPGEEQNSDTLQQPSSTLMGLIKRRDRGIFIPAVTGQGAMVPN